MTDERRDAGQVPVAGVVVDSPLAHLDRVFEYAVPAEWDALARPGVRVRVPFAGRELDGFVVSRPSVAVHAGPLASVRRVVSPEPVLTPGTLALARAVADRYAGTLADVLRLAVPKRHAAAEKALPAHGPALDALPAPDPGPWAAYPAGEAFLRRVTEGEAPGAAWVALPGRPRELDWPAALATAAAAALAGGRGALLVVPDHRDVDRVDAALREAVGPGRHVRLTADQGPQARYTAWLKILRGHVRCVVGTRAAAFAPVRELGLVAVWDDGDDLFEEPRSPYPHVREVVLERARAEKAALVVGGFGRSVPVQELVERGVLVDVRPGTEALRGAGPRVSVAGEGSDPARDPAAARARLPSSAWSIAKAALTRGPVLVQVPRGGYLPGLRCADCRASVRCRRCGGPMVLTGAQASPTCSWCGHADAPGAFRCPHCDGQRLRSGWVGSERTAEELGRAFPGVGVHTSGGDRVLASIGPEPALVVATPGAEPVAADGYAACLLLDSWALLDREGLDAPVEALRRWLAAAALTRPASDGGAVVLCGVPGGPRPRPVEALVRWDPVWLAAAELAERRELRLPPTVVMAELVGTRTAVAEAADRVLGELADLAHGAGSTGERLGPLPPPRERGSGEAEATREVLRADRSLWPALAQALRTVKAQRSARKDLAPLAVRLDWDGTT